MNGKKGNASREDLNNSENVQISRYMLRTPLLCLKILGLWIPESNKGTIKMELLYSIYSKFVLFLLLAFTASAVISLKDSTTNLLEFTDNILITTVTANCVAKMWPLIFWRKSVLKSLDSLDELMDTWGVVPSTQSSQEERKKTIEVWERRLRIASLIGFFGTAIADFLWNSFPFVPTGEVDRELRLPFGGWFPFEARWKHPGYWWAFGFQFVASLYDAFGTTATNSLYLSILLYACLCTKSLQHALRDICTTDSPQQNERLYDVIRRHQLVLRFVEEISEYLGPLMFFESVVMSLLLCSTVVHLTMVDIWSTKFISVTVFALLIMNELFIYCWLGTVIQLESMQCSMDVYHSEWFNAQPPVKTLLRIVMMRAQKPAVIRGFRYTTLSLELFTSLVRLSYSLNTLLRRVTD